MVLKIRLKFEHVNNKKYTNTVLETRFKNRMFKGGLLKTVFKYMGSNTVH